MEYAEYWDNLPVGGDEPSEVLEVILKFSKYKNNPPVSEASLLKSYIQSLE